MCTEYIRLRPRVSKPAPLPAPPPPTMSKPAVELAPLPAVAAEDAGEEKIKQGTSCLPCTNSHLHACVGLLNEAIRMSPDELTMDGMERIDKCLGEIAAAERVDLAVENMDTLPPGEKELAQHMSSEIREIRHGLEGITGKPQLEQLAIRTHELQKYVGKEWFKARLAKMPKEEKSKLVEKALETLEQED